MHRTQIYLDEALAEEVKEIAKSRNISMSALIREIIKKEIKKYKNRSFAQLIEELEPLESFKNVDAKKYVDEIRKKSRIVQ